ncbi:MAG: GTPase (G3E family) [Lachnospiraceae bacterium]|nr:GTPase (G3E family) [Lachnospiraceae bacterium]
MIKIDLITGFLGAGKTTFLKKYADYLIRQGQHICILENDFGAVNVDMMLMQDMLCDSCDLEMVAGGCDKDCHIRRFRTKLISMGMRGFDRVVVEPSGVFDVDEFFDVLREEPLDQWYEIGSVITVVDACLEEKLSDAAEYLLAAQAANAGCILFSKCQTVSDERLQASIAHLKRALKKAGCNRDVSADIFCKDWEQLTDADMERIVNSGRRNASFEKYWFDQEKEFQTLYFMNRPFNGETIAVKAREALQDSSCGAVERIKGFVRDKEGWLQLNATRENFSLKPIGAGQEIIIVIGEDLRKERLEHIFTVEPVYTKAGQETDRSE